MKTEQNAFYYTWFGIAAAPWSLKSERLTFKYNTIFLISCDFKDVA